MKCGEITDRVLEAIESGKYEFIRLNYPNGDMVGHSGRQSEKSTGYPKALWKNEKWASTADPFSICYSGLGLVIWPANIQSLHIHRFF
jgi:hypothetical protein